MNNERLYVMYVNKNIIKEGIKNKKKIEKIVLINSCISKLKEIMSLEECYESLSDNLVYRYNVNDDNWGDEIVLEELNNYVKGESSKSVVYSCIYNECTKDIEIRVKFS